MVAEVQILPQTLINKIAAGEVIVRPGSVVKELVENSFDAEARHVRVEISTDGRSISVIDDGDGMDEENAKRAILRSATSKIRDFEDLEQLLTRGFRGEAIASIISVSRFEMLTRSHGALAGTRIVAEGGKVLKVEPVGTAEGTTIHVRELFYNTPARLKFLKTPRAEFNMVAHLLTQQALSHPESGVACVRNGASHFDLPPGQGLRARIEDLLGSTVQDKLIAVDYERDGFAVRGYVTRPEASRKDRRWQYLMVNGRPIGAKQLSFPIQEAYRGLLMQQRFPIVVLDMQMDPREVDVNVHPTKEEVRFEEERKVAGLLHRAISEALAKQNLIPTLEMRPPESITPPTATASPETPRSSEGGPGASAAPGGDPSLPFLFSPKGVRPFSPTREGRQAPVVGPRQTQGMFPIRDFTRTSARADAPPATEQTDCGDAGPCEGPTHAAGPFDTPGASLALGDGPPPTPLGQIGRTYIVAEWGDDLLMIDQHAAHERLIYQRLAAQARGAVARQPLLIPLPVSVAAADTDAMEALVPLLGEMGIDIEPQGQGEYAVTAMPAEFDSIDAAAAIQDILDEAQETMRATGGLDALRDRAQVRVACHAAIKAGQQLHADEMVALIAEMAEARLSFTCPHGRPTMVVLRKGQLDRQFGREG